MAALEAIAGGIPVLASAVGGLPEAIMPGRTGWLSPPGEVDEFVRRLLDWHALTEADRRQMGVQARDLARERFGAAQGIARLLKVYRNAGWTDSTAEAFA